jgi:hypothetical protein
MKLIWETSNIERPTSNIERGEVGASFLGWGRGGRVRTPSPTKVRTRTIGNGFAFWTVRGNPNDIICEHDYD